MEAHEICETWPEIPLDQFKKMVTSIRTSGLIQSITTFEGKILDGRHRYRACIEAGVSPRFEQYKGDDPVGFSQAANDHRRHATPSQRAIQAIKLLDYEKRMAKLRQIASGGDKRAGDAFGRHPLTGHESKGNGPQRPSACCRLFHERLVRPQHAEIAAEILDINILVGDPMPVGVDDVELSEIVPEAFLATFAQALAVVTKLSVDA